MNLTLAIVLVVFLVLFFATVCFALYVWWKKSIYTRERFAFAGLATLSTVGLFVLTTLYAQQPPWLAAFDLISHWSGVPYEPPKPLTWEQIILSVLLVGFLGWFILRLHKQWNKWGGAKSIEQYRREQTAREPSLLADSWLYLRHFREPGLLKVYEPDFALRHTMLEGAGDSLAWRDQARDLLCLSSKTYDFPDANWHDQMQCWIGRHKGTGDVAVLACYEHKPDDAKLHELEDYVERVRQNQGLGGSSMEFIIALKHGELDENTKFAGYPLRYISESRLLDNLVDFSDYFRDLRQRVERNNLTESQLTISDVYTVSSYKLAKEAEPLRDIEGYLNEWLLEQSKRQLALLGEYGQGKSTASLMLSYHLLQRIEQGDRSTRVPILLELRGKSPRNLREDELVSTWAGRYGIDTRALLKLQAAGRLLMIFEGFDEVDLSGDVEARLRHFGVMWRLCYPKAKILVTGRPNFFLDDAELKAALGIQEPSLERPYCQALYLAPFNVPQIENSLRNLDGKSRKEIVALAKGNEKFREIVARPSLLRVVSVLWRNEKLAEYQDRINSAVVMDLFLRHSYRRQGAKGEKHDFMALTHRERAYFMEGIAVYMLVNWLPNQISTHQLDEAVRLLTEAIPDAVSLQTDAVSGETRKPLRQRFDLQNRSSECVEHIKTDVRACGLLVTDLSRSDSFKFGHKSFMEFLAGKVFAQWSIRKDLAETDRLAAASLVNRLGLKMHHITDQQETLDFAIEWIADKAKNQDEAAKTLFNTIFGLDPLMAKIAAPWLKFSIRILGNLVTHLGELKARYTSIAASLISGITFIASFLALIYIYLPRIDPHVGKYNLVVIFTVLITASLISGFFRNVFLIKQRPRRFAFEHSSILLATTIIFMSITLSIGYVFLVMGLVKEPAIDLSGVSIYILMIAASFTLYETARQVSGFIPRERMEMEYPHGSWFSLEFWHTSCLLARLDRQAMIKVIGEKALRWLDDERVRRLAEQVLHTP